MIFFWAIGAALALAVAALIAAPLLGKSPTASAPGRMAALFFLGAAPLLGALIYLRIGEPAALTIAQDEVAAPDEALPQDERREMVNAMVERLAARLDTDPDDPQGWRMLARSYAVLGELENAAAAWREALARSEGSGEDWRAYAGVLLAMRESETSPVRPETRAALLKVIETRPDDPLALFFLGLAASQNDAPADAVDYWTRLRERLPENAPILAQLDAQIEAAQAAMESAGTE